MNNLPNEKQTEIVAALTEGCSIRSVERLTGVHRDTIMRLGVRVGMGCAALHDVTMRNLQVPLIEMDELWAFVGKKQRRLTAQDGTDKGDQYTFLAIDALSKAILSYRVGKRDGENTEAFVADLRMRVLNTPQISSDAFAPYEHAMRKVFGEEVHYGQIVKRYVGEPPVNAARRYSPGAVVGVTKDRVIGFPTSFQISTSYVERTNLSVRMGSRRFTRLTSGFSKKLENHSAAVALFVSHFNLCRVHEALRVTPAMELGVADHVWTIGELIDAALSGVLPQGVGRRVGRFTVIDGGGRN